MRSELITVGDTAAGAATASTPENARDDGQQSVRRQRLLQLRGHLHIDAVAIVGVQGKSGNDHNGRRIDERIHEGGTVSSHRQIEQDHADVPFVEEGKRGIAVPSSYRGEASCLQDLGTRRANCVVVVDDEDVNWPPGASIGQRGHAFCGVGYAFEAIVRPIESTGQ
jgi:hypothetical protein